MLLCTKCANMLKTKALTIHRATFYLWIIVVSYLDNGKAATTEAVVTSPIPEPEACKNPINIGDPYRSSVYTMPASEPKLCDNSLDGDIWYRLESYCGNKLYVSCVSLDKCGTQFPIYTTSVHPTVPYTEQAMSICSPSSTDCCGTWTETVTAILCSANAVSTTDFYIYKLKRVPQCDMAYCAGSGTPCTEGTVWNNVTNTCSVGVPEDAYVGYPEFSDPKLSTMTDYFGEEFVGYYFHCRTNYEVSEDDGALFDVYLTFDGKLSSTYKTTNSHAMDVRFDSWDLEGNLGKCISCAIQSYWSSSTLVKSEFRYARNCYFVGLQYSTDKYNALKTRIEFNDNTDSVDLFTNVTVPISCGAKCKVSFTLNYTDMVTTSSCHVTFHYTDQPDDDHILKIYSTKNAGAGPSSSLITFTRIPPRYPVNPEYSWEGYQAQLIPTYITDGVPLKACSSVTTGNTLTFDGQAVSHGLAGDFIRFTSTSTRYYMVQARMQACWSSTNVFCNCAIAVREGNNALGVYACDENKPILTEEYMKDDNLPGAHILTSKDGKTYSIVMPSGANVTMNIGETLSSTGEPLYYMDVYVYPISDDIYKADGQCGNYNDISSDDAQSSDSIQYLLAPEDSLINGNVQPCVNFSSPIPSICSCEESMGNSTVNCDPISSVPGDTPSIDNCINSDFSSSKDMGYKPSDAVNAGDSGRNKLLKKARIATYEYV